MILRLTILAVLTGWARGEEPEPALYSRLIAEQTAWKPTVVFLHGGPGYNCATFEIAVAEGAAGSIRMLVYDRAGCGRSGAGSKGSYSFAGAVRDLHRVIRKHGATKPLLVGHSFGGTLALRAFDAKPDAFAGVVLVSSPISYPDALTFIVEKCRLVYDSKKDEAGRRMLDYAAAMKPGPTRAGYLFQHAMRCGLYSPAKISGEAPIVKREMQKSSAAKYFGDMRREPFLGFWNSERYTTLDVSSLVKKHRRRVFAIYGAEDWALGKTGRATLLATLPKGHVAVIENASHSVFIDSHIEFMDALRTVREKLGIPPLDAGTRAARDCRKLHGMCGFYALSQKRYPKTLKDLLTLKDPSLKALPKDPWGQEYRLVWRGKRWGVVSAGPDGVLPSGDDIRYFGRSR